MGSFEKNTMFVANKHRTWYNEIVALNIAPAIAVATTEADEAITSSDFLKIMGISFQKGANWGDSGQFWSLVHFASSDFNVWLRSYQPLKQCEICMENFSCVLNYVFYSVIWSAFLHKYETHKYRSKYAPWTRSCTLYTPHARPTKKASFLWTFLVYEMQLFSKYPVKTFQHVTILVMNLRMKTVSRTKTPLFTSRIVVLFGTCTYAPVAVPVAYLAMLSLWLACRGIKWTDTTYHSLGMQQWTWVLLVGQWLHTVQTVS